MLSTQIKDAVKEEAGALSHSLSAEFVKKFDALSESLVSAQACHSGKMDKVLEDVKSVAMQMEGAAALDVLGDMRAVASQLETLIKEQASLQATALRQVCFVFSCLLVILNDV